MRGWLRVFPGNSGGIIVSKNLCSTQQKNETTYALGIIKSFLGHEEKAYTISGNTHTARVIFKENSGLIQIIPFDFVFDILKENKTEETVIEHCHVTEKV